MAPENVSSVGSTMRFEQVVDGRPITCPHCGRDASFQVCSVSGWAIDIERSSQVQEIRTQVIYKAYFPTNENGSEGYAIGRCPNCRKEFVAERQYMAASVRVVWPLPNVNVPDVVPEPVRSAVIDAKRAYAADSRTGTIMSLRTAVERIQRQQRVSSLTELWERESFPSRFFDAANENRLWGHMVAHDDIDPADVTEGDIQELLNLFDILLDVVYVTESRLGAIRRRREEVAAGSDGDTDTASGGERYDQGVLGPG